MADLNATQIAEHAYKAGFRGDALTTAVAVAMAESGGNTHAHNAVPPDNSYGLWQINMIGSLGPARRQEYGLHSDSELFNPDENAKAAWDISDHGKSFTPWTTYTDGAYRSHLAAARHAAHVVATHHGHTGGGQRHGHQHHGHQHGTQHGGHHGKQGGQDGFHVDIPALRDYVTTAREVHTQLSTLHEKQVPQLLATDDKVVGGIGRDSGFTTALLHYFKREADKIHRIAHQSAHVADRVAQDIENYQHNEKHHAKSFAAVQSDLPHTAGVKK